METAKNKKEEAEKIANRERLAQIKRMDQEKREKVFNENGVKK